MQDRLSEAGVGASVGTLGDEVHKTKGRKLDSSFRGNKNAGGINGGTGGDAIV